MLREVIVISGPTASGKSDLALKMANKCSGAIINADSMQLYQELPILSAQPSEEDKRNVPHYLYGILTHQERSSVASWLDLAKRAIEECWLKNYKPIIVGGTGMYISKLIEGINYIPEISLKNQRKAIKTFREIGIENFKKKLPHSKALDKQRLIRAYEVLLETGKPIEYWQSLEKKKIIPDAIFKNFNLNPDRKELYERCNQRFADMIEAGAVREVENLIKNYKISQDLSITKTLGFTEIKDYLVGKISKEKMIETSTQKTRNYAKRQMTWFRNQMPDKVIIDL